MIGQTLGSYTVERELGRGGMGAVYRGVHTLLGRHAAVKVLLAELSRDEAAVQRFFNEARAATAIRHPSIVEVYDFGWSADGAAYIIMELLDGEALGARLARVATLPIATALVIARQIATALAAAHKAGIVHRDLKPDNIFLVPDPEVVGGERVKLLDFGIAKLMSDTGGLAKTTTGAIIGTPYYMSPEQCEGSRAVDHRSDLYALGCILFQMVSGRLPFEGEGLGGILGAHQFVPAPALRGLVPQASPELDGFVARLLAKAPSDRPASADEVAATLERLGASAATAATTGRTPAVIATTAIAGPTTAPAAPPRDLATAPTISHTPAPPTTMSAPTPTRRWWIPAVAIGAIGAAAIAVVALRGAGSSTPIDAALAVTAPLDAGFDAGPDGPGGPDAGAEVLAAQAQQALDDRRWDTALALGNDLLAANHPMARAIVSQARQGKTAADAVAAMEAAAARNDAHTVRAKLDVVYDTTLDGDPDRARADAIIASVRPGAIARANAEVTRLVAAGKCMDARAVVAEASVDWGSDNFTRAQQAANRCKASAAPPSVPTPTDPTPTDPTPTDPTPTDPTPTDPPPDDPPPDDPPPDPRVPVDAVLAAVASAAWPEALAACQRVPITRMPRGDRRAAVVQACARAGCNAKQPRLAARYIALLPRAERQAALQVCIDQGLLMPMDLLLDSQPKK